MADLSRKTASIYINHDAADAALQKLQAQADKLTNSIRKGEAAGKDMVDQLNKLNDVKGKIDAVQRQIDAGLKPSFNQLQLLVSKTRAELRKMSESDPGFAAKAKELNKYSTEMSRLGSQIGVVRTQGEGIKELLPAIGWAAAAAAAAGFFKGAVDEALEANKITAQFENTLDKAGRSEAFDRLARAADNMAAHFKFLDNDDITHVFDKLISYGKLTEAQVLQLTPVIIDFAAKSKRSLDDAATVIIKALAGQGRELEDYGVHITRTQTDAERLSLIMNDLGEKVKGAGDAFEQSAQGSIADTQQAIKNLKEEIGTKLLPFLKGFYSSINSIIDGIYTIFRQSGKGVDDLIAEAGQQQQQSFADFANNIATEMGTKPLDEQKKLAESYKAIYLNSQKALHDFLNSSNKDNQEERARLLAQQDQDQQIYLATQRTLNDSINTEKKNQAAKEKEEADKRAKEAEKRRQEELKKAAEFAKQLQKIWDDLNARINDSNAVLNDPELEAIHKITDQAKTDTDNLKLLLKNRVIDYQQYSDAIVKIEEIRHARISELVQKYKGKQGDISVDPSNPSLTPALNTTGAISTTNPNSPQVQADLQKKFIDDLAGYQLQSEISTGKKRLEAQRAVLELEKTQELANKNLTENQKLLIEEKYRQKSIDLEKQHWQDVANIVLSYAQQAADIFNAFTDLKIAKDEQMVQQNQAAYDKDKNALDRQLAQKVISQKEYDQQLSILDLKKQRKDAELKKKEFELNKQQQIVQATINGATAVVSALQAPWPLDLIEAALVTGMVAAQIAKISSQKPPQFAKGGMLDGPTHSQGGLPVVNPRTGRKVAEVEGGEAILSRNTVINNRSVVDALLRSSMYGNGAPITPYWQQRPAYTPINYSGVTQSIERVRHYATGGIFGAGIGTDSGTMSSLNAAIENMNSAVQTSNAINYTLSSKIDRLSNKIDQPFKSFVLLSEANKEQAILDKIKADTTITR